MTVRARAAGPEVRGAKVGGCSGAARLPAFLHMTFNCITGRLRAVRWSIVLAGLLLAGGARAEETAPRTDALRVLDALQRAHQARTERVELQAGAQAEAARIAAQIAEAEARTELASARARRARDELAELRAEAGPLDAREAELSAAMDAVATRINDALDALARSVLPDVIPSAAQPAPARSEDRFEAALDRLDQTERRLSQIEVGIVETQLDGDDIAVEVLRFGGAAAWWRTLDGDRYGVVHVVDGRVALQPRTGPDLSERVERAFAIAKGRAAPDLLNLPLEPLTPDAEKGPAS